MDKSGTVVYYNSIFFPAAAERAAWPRSRQRQGYRPCACRRPDTDISADLGGDVVMMGVPAEECIEITYRKKLRDEGKLWFISGKQEFLRLGEFDDIDAAIMQHTAIINDEYSAGATSNNNGQNTAANVKANSGKIKISESDAYTDKEHVAAYINEYKRLPHNYITKNEAKKLGWQTKGTLL